MKFLFLYKISGSARLKKKSKIGNFFFAHARIIQLNIKVLPYAYHQHKCAVNVTAVLKGIIVTCGRLTSKKGKSNLLQIAYDRWKKKYYLCSSKF